MGVLLALGAQGLISWPPGPSAPLRRVDVVGAQGRLLVDNDARQCSFEGRPFSCAPEITDACCWQGHPLLLSGEGDSVTLHSREGTPLVTAPAGFAPRALCLLPEGTLLAVAGGLSGEVLILRLPALTLVQALAAPGAPMCLAVSGRWLYAACAVGDAEMHCLLCRYSLTAGRWETGPLFAGLPGALAAAPWGEVYLGCTERLYRLNSSTFRVLSCREGIGLPRRILCGEGQVLAADPVLCQALAFDPRLRDAPRLLWQGEIADACLV